MDNEKILIISDVHLDPRVPDRQNNFLAFLEKVLEGMDRLIILGDLFEFWFGYKSVIFHHYFPTLITLWKFTQSGKPVHYLPGNHDFFMGAFIEQTLKIDFIKHGFNIKLGGKHYYLCHGDCINRRDYGYRLLHKITHNSITKGIFSLIPPDLGIYLAFKLSDMSRYHTTNRDKVPRNSIETFFHQKLSEGFDGLIFGHTHKPEYTEVEWNGKQVTLINTGDWIQHSTYVIADNGKITLHEWK